MAFKRLNFKLFFFFFSFLTFSTFAQEVDIEAGKTLFKNQCASCHNKDMKSKMTGPALGAVEERWDDQADLYEWIRNSQGMIAAGHPRAVELWNEWKPVAMNSFPNLTDENIANILGYVDAVYTGAIGGPATGDPPLDECAVPTAAEDSNRLMYLFLFAVLALLALILTRIISQLNHINQVKETGIAPEKKTLAEVLTSRSTISFVIFLAVVVGGYITVQNATNLGRQQGYQPEQPINFSHIIHACEHEIDCNYCHDGARRSKHAVIPAANTCMNCHKAIKNGSRWGTQELTKIYASVGFDPNTDKYIENYEDLSEEEIKKIYTRWISNQAIENGATVDEAQEMELNQWDGIVEALTNPDGGDNTIAGPIEWVRIHNLPDHVYFDHSQHVSVGKIECQQCHGKIEQMAVVKQYSPLSMGWCINCHRQSQVKFADNGYYQNYYENYHKEIENLDRSAVTVEDIGGTECQKCHY